MGRGALPALTALLLVCGTGCGEAADEVVVTDTVPAEWIARPGAFAQSTTLVWLFRTDDCLTCQSFDYAVRRLQAIYGDSVPFVAVHIGDASREQVPRSFFRSRRISVARLITVPPRSFRRSDREGKLPALLVVHGRRVVWTSTLPQGVATAAQVDSIVRSVREANVRRVAADSGSKF